MSHVSFLMVAISDAPFPVHYLRTRPRESGRMALPCVISTSVTLVVLEPERGTPPLLFEWVAPAKKPMPMPRISVVL
jgi:hypothetical protein